MSIETAYVCGVLHGDGWCGVHVGLRAKDRDFVEAFALALGRAVGRPIVARADRQYWRAVTRNTRGALNWLKAYEPASDDERGAWLRGFFDSEGCVNLRRSRPSGNSWRRSVTMYNTLTSTIRRAVDYLICLGIPSNVTPRKNTTGHRGTKVVYEIRILCSRQNYALFVTRVGCSIERKARVLAAIDGTYTADFRAHCRAAQLLGAAAKRRKTETVTRPAVVNGIRELIRRGVKPTQRNCLGIPGYATAVQFKHSNLVREALQCGH